MSAQRSGLAKRLVADQLISCAQAQWAMQSAPNDDSTFVSRLTCVAGVSPAAIAHSAADEFGLPLLDLNTIDQGAIPQRLVEPKLIAKYGILPILHKKNHVVLALSDPSIIPALNEINFQTGLRSEVVLVADDVLKTAIKNYLSQLEDGEVDIAAAYSPHLDELHLVGDETTDSHSDESEQLDETPIVRFVNKMLLDAIKNGASDIHIEIYERSYRIRFRIDGVLHTATRPPHNFASRIASRIKVIAKLDISERRLPQDGHIKVKLAQSRALHFRVSTLPTHWGEKIVLRLLDPASARLGIESLGYSDWQKEQVLQAISRHQGMVLVTGPTGSGKTVSLYAALNFLNSGEINIASAEDPVEINVEGVNQVSISSKIGLDFATTLRALLRQDPDVLMVGEIRDRETAEMAIKASQTGHLVLSTLHTNSAAETLSRLRFMGIPPYNIATAITLIIAQRLARKLCDHCKECAEFPEKVLRDQGFKSTEIKHLQIYKAKGCEKCRDGYRGRLGIYEVVPITPAIARTIMDDGDALKIAEQARAAGFDSLRRAALLKVSQGLTSLEEAIRLT
ncbi:MAG: type IV-A pilus assembly ATPase PilB [Pseudomonadales bacterium]|nr:type IV-A pilus assembly ATPase PilB [Pseudomonadales bacterium]